MIQASLFTTTGDLIRALKPHFANTYDLNIAVNNYRREHGSKNWVAAAAELLKELNNGS